MPTPWEEGLPESPLLVLAEAPAKTELRLGRPLCGQSGDIFNECLHQAGLVRRQCYILNTWPFAVYRDRAGHIIEHNRNIKVWDCNKGLTAEGWDAARPTLHKIEESGCNAILAMGNPALDVLTGHHRKIMKWRGSPLWSNVVHRKFIPTVHPAAVVHGNYIWRYLIINDMGKVREDLDTRELMIPKRDLRIRPTIADIGHFIHECRRAGIVATDLEAVNNQVSCFSLCYDPSIAMTVPIVGPGGAPYWDEDDEIWIWQQYAKLLADHEVVKVNQNIVGFDRVFLLTQCNIHIQGTMEDTMIAQHVLYPDFPKGLDFIASMHTREPYWKDDGKIWKKVSWDWDVFQRYCGTDSAVALEAWYVLKGELERDGFWQTYQMTMEMADPLCYMAVDGLPVDKEGLAITNERLAGLIEEGEQRLFEMCGRELNVNSPKQCAEYFYEHLGLSPYKNRDGGVTTDDKAMSRIARRASKGSQEAKQVQMVRRYKKLKSTYMEVETDDDDKLRCSWNPRGTWTGRLSSSKTIKGTGMNLQNLDSQFKGFIVAG